MTIGFNADLYILPFDHRGSFQTKMFGWTGVIYEGLKAAVSSGVPQEKAGILVDEQFGAAILHDARKRDS